MTEATFALVNLITDTDTNCLTIVLTEEIKTSFPLIVGLVKHLCHSLEKSNSTDIKLVPIIFDALTILVGIEWNCSQSIGVIQSYQESDGESIVANWITGQSTNDQIC